MTTQRASSVHLLPAAAAACLLLSGCGAGYFVPADDVPAAPTRHAMAAIPFDEYWTGLVFNGHKVGFTHLAITPAQAGGYELRSEAAMRFRFLTIDKAVTLKAVDRVAEDLTLQAFEYDYDLDGSRLALSGRIEGDVLMVHVRNRDAVEERRFEVRGPLYPSSVIALYPVTRGLAVGREYRYRVFDGETQQVADVAQSVLAYERSELFDGPAYRVRTRLHGQEATTWIGLDGRPLLEQSMNGIFFSGLEPESMARRYLTLAALNKEETLLEFSLIRVQPPIAAPRAVSSLVIELGGLDGFTVPSDALQDCKALGAGRVRCTVGSGPAGTGTDADTSRWLVSTLPAPSRDPRIRRLAGEIAAGHGSQQAQVAALVRWIGDNVEPAAVDVFSALDVLASRRAECQGNSYLYAALARALGIPTRVVNGIAYSELADAFVWHAWAESVVEGRWQRVDPTFGQAAADATHLKLITGETLAEIAPMAALVGRIEARLVSVTAGGAKAGRG